jgi:endonuclease/exonuclease/phosphatase family metal-dependent hydrolase
MSSSLAKQDVEITMLNYNVWGIPRHLGGGSAARYELIFKQIEQGPYSIATLQEAWSRKILALSNLTSFPYIAGREGAGRMIGAHGLLTLSRHPIIQEESLIFSRSLGVERHCCKGALFTRIVLPNDQLLDVYNVHLLSATSLLSEERARPVRAAQIEELHRWVQARTEAGIPVVVLGDFNVHDEEIQYKDLVAAFGNDLYRERNSEAVCGIPLPRDRANGFTFDPVRNHWARSFWASRHDSRPKRLDYCFLGNISRDYFMTESSLDFKHSLYKGKPLSDHFALRARIRLLKQE